MLQALQQIKKKPNDTSHIVKLSLSKIQGDEQKGNDLTDFVDDIFHKNEANENKMAAENKVSSKMTVWIILKKQAVLTVLIATLI